MSYKEGIADKNENRGYYSRKMLKYDLQNLNSQYNIRILFNKQTKMYELYLDYRTFAVARDIQELYQIISSLNQFKIHSKSSGKVTINGELLEAFYEKSYIKKLNDEFGQKFIDSLEDDSN